MTRFKRFIRKYPILCAVFFGIILATTFELLTKQGLSNAALTVISLVSLFPATKKLFDTLRYGYFGIQILPIVGIVLSLALREFWSAAILALLLSVEEPLTQAVLKRSHPKDQKGISLRVVKHAPFVRFLDKASLPLIVLVFLIGGAVWIVTGDSSRFLEAIASASTASILIAAPISIAVGMNRLKSFDINCSSAVLFEKLGNAQTLILKKTGVVTKPDSFVQKVVAYSGSTQANVLRVASALATSSSHHLAQAIVRYAGETGKVNRAKHVQEVSGMGLVGRMKSINLAIGRLSFLETLSISAPKNPSKISGPVVYVAENDKIIGHISFEESLSDGAKNFYKKLKKIGLESLVLVSGGSAESLAVIAKETGIKSWHADTKPADVINLVEKSSKRPVVFVGDSNSDSAVMHAADVAISSSESTASSQLSIAEFSLNKLFFLLSSSKLSMRNCWRISIGGLFVSLLVIVVAASGILNPPQAALLNLTISVAVILFSGLRGSSVEPSL